MLRSLVLLAGALIAATACSPLSARPLVDVAVVDRDSGDWLPAYPHRGQQWIAGAPGHRYAVAVDGQSPGPFLDQSGESHDELRFELLVAGERVKPAPPPPARRKRRRH